MSFNKRMLSTGAAASITPSEHFGIVLYKGDATTSHKINGGKFGPGANTSNDGVVTLPDNIIDVPEHSVSVWFYMDETSGTQHLMEFDETNRIIIRCASGDSNWAYVGNSGYFNHGMSFSVDTWYHIVVTFKEGSPFKIYKNGSLEYTHGSNVDRYANNSNNDVGAGSSAGGSNVEGKIDQLRIFHKELSASEVTTLYQESATTVTSLTPLGNETEDTLDVFGDSSCLALYKFENDETDASGNYNGTGTSIQYAAGRFGQCASFNGTSSKITTGGKPLNNDTSISISFWAKNINYGDYMSILGEGGDSTTAGYRLLWKNSNDGNMALARSNGDGSYIIPDSYFYDFGVDGSSWVHCAFTVSSSEMKYYKNGANVLTQSVSNSSSTAAEGNFGIGADPNYPTRLWSGQIDQVRLFNKTLSASEVTSLYKENSLVASYRFEGNVEDDRRTYNGTATNLSYDYALGFTPDLIWTKRRNEGSDHNITDSTRGVRHGLNPNTTAVEGDQDPYGVLSFDSGGFTVSDNAGGGASVNGEDDDYVSWCWRANGGTTSTNTDGSINTTVQTNTDAGFSIITYTGDGASTSTIGHGLDSAPELVLLKTRSHTSDWPVYSSGTTNAGYRLVLNLNDAESTTNNPWNSTAPTSTVINLGSSGNVNISSRTFVAYAWHSVDGFSKIGSYMGNGDAYGPIVETGFEPAFLMLKRRDNAGSWAMIDNKRTPTNPRNLEVFANLGDADNTFTAVDFLSNGFQIINTSNTYNASNDKFIYMAFAADPDEEAPTLAKSFDIKAYTGNQSTNSITGVGFRPDLIWLKERSGTDRHVLFDIFRGDDSQLTPDSDAAVTTYASNLDSFDTDGFTLGDATETNGNNETYVAWLWKANDNEPTRQQITETASATAVYKFEDDANDVTGNNNGTASNVSYVTGKFGKAADFNGSTSIITTGLNTGNNNMTFSAWVNLDAASSGIYGMVCSGISHYYTYLAVGQNGKVWVSNDQQISGDADNGYATEGTTVLATGTWYHIAGSLSSTEGAKIYVNGQLEKTQPARTTNAPSRSDYSGIGCWKSSNGNLSGQFNGQIDQVRFYDKVLDDVSIYKLFKETATQNSTVNIGTEGVLSTESKVSANANAGFSIVKWEGTGYATSVPHGLSTTPDLVIVKRLDGTTNWQTWYTGAGTSPGSGINRVYLNTTDDNDSSTTNVFYPDATKINLNSGDHFFNSSDSDYIAYCWHSVTGYSKIGTFTGSSSAKTVTTGFKPDFVMIKRTIGGDEEWNIIDSVRGGDRRLKADSTAAEVDESSDYITFAATSFTITVTGNASLNNNGDTFLYVAFKIN